MQDVLQTFLVFRLSARLWFFIDYADGLGLPDALASISFNGFGSRKLGWLLPGHCYISIG